MDKKFQRHTDTRLRFQVLVGNVRFEEKYSEVGDFFNKRLCFKMLEMKFSILIVAMP